MTPSHLGACGAGRGFAAIALDATGAEVWRRDIAYRAHDVIAFAPRDLCAVVGRKPGPGASLRSLSTGALIREIAPLPGCTFDGHAVFSADGSILYATQSEGAGQIGHIGVYEATDGELLGRFPTQGVEPHELVWSADGESLIVGNGGIVDRNATDPIESSLVRLDAVTGKLLSRTNLDEEDETLSLRHLAVLADGRVVCGAQDQDPATGLRPLVLLFDAAGKATPLDLPRDIHRRLAGYIGSVAVDRSGTVICATAPRGGLAVFWCGTDARYLGHTNLADVCGVAAGGESGTFLLSSGHGCRRKVKIPPKGGPSPEDVPAADALQWDNHLAAIFR